MGMPILTAVLGLATGLGLIGLLGHPVDIPTVGPTLATMIGLGVGIDHALFLVTKHRDQMANGMERHESIARAVALRRQAAALSAQGAALRRQANELAAEGASLQRQADALQQQADSLKKQQQQAEEKKKQTEQLKQELTEMMTKAGGDDRGTDPRLVKLQDALATPANVSWSRPRPSTRAGTRPPSP